MTDRDALLEATLSAHRERDEAGRPRPAPAWADLSPDDRAAAFEASLVARALESGWDPQGRNATVRVVARRVLGLRQG
ncbi:MAG TPA: hypothetical protein VF139_08615 [Candidatus Polarisedimenticolaceae bacterium]